MSISISSASRTAAVAATIALLLTACGTRTAPVDAQAADTLVPATAAVDTATLDTAPLDTATLDTVPVETAPVETAPLAPTTPAPAATPTTSAQPAVSSAPAARQAATTSACAASQRPDGGQYFVAGIRADDPDGGLVARVLPGAANEARTVLPEGTMVETYWSDGSDGPSGCAVLSDGSVWYDISHPSLATGGWVNARYLEMAADDHIDQPEEEADAHADCVVLPDLPDTCTVVFSLAGEIVSVDPMSSDMQAEFHHACVYQGHDPACAVLAFRGPGDGIGNSLTMAPTEFLAADCASLTGVAQKLACAELATR